MYRGSGEGPAGGGGEMALDPAHAGAVGRWERKKQGGSPGEKDMLGRRWQLMSFAYIITTVALPAHQKQLAAKSPCQWWLCDVVAPHP